MKLFTKKWILTAAIFAGGIGLMGLMPSRMSPVSVARAESSHTAIADLKADAIKALRDGQFSKSRELLLKAAGLDQSDPTFSKWVNWSNQFQKQQDGFVSERHTQYEKAVEEVQKLIKAHKESFVIEFTRNAHLLSDDKTEFRKLPWVDEVITKAIDHAKDYEGKEQWLKCMRIYSALGSLEPDKAEWKNKLKLATRRIRLVALYTPDQLKVLQESESKEREELDAVLHPSTQPSSKPATQAAKDKEDENSDNFKLDWHETLKGVKMESLRDALLDARADYYRDERPQSRGHHCWA
jgi:hypothetical protein